MRWLSESRDLLGSLSTWTRWKNLKVLSWHWKFSWAVIVLQGLQWIKLLRKGTGCLLSSHISYNMTKMRLCKFQKYVQILACVCKFVLNTNKNFNQDVRCCLMLNSEHYGIEKYQIWNRLFVLISMQGEAPEFRLLETVQTWLKKTKINTPVNVGIARCG